jgi:hypothetical protein
MACEMNITGENGYEPIGESLSSGLNDGQEPEERWHQDEAKTSPLAASAASQHPRPGFLATMWPAVPSLTARHARSQSHGTHIPQRFELSIERIAREHPFLIIIAMSGLS